VAGCLTQVFKAPTHGYALPFCVRAPCRQVVDTQLVAAMGPPGGGRNPVSNRVLRHFNILSFAEVRPTH
jgi:hypothetical protein